MPQFQISLKKLPDKKAIAAEKEKKKKEKAIKREKEVKSASMRTRRKETEALLFGSALFEPVAKREKEIVVSFPDKHTLQGIYISRCGKFGYARTTNDFFYNLFYFIDAIESHDETLEIIPSETIWLFDSMSCAELEDTVIRLKRAEYEEEKQKLLEEIREKDKERQREIDKEKEDEEKEAEQLELLGKSIVEEAIEVQEIVNEIIEAVEEHTLLTILNEGETANVSLLDIQEDKIECGAVISEDKPPTFLFKKFDFFKKG